MYKPPYHNLPEEEPEEGAPLWMITFADMTTLLMAFFVLLLSFANTDIQKFKKMAGSVQQSFGAKEEAPAPKAPPAEDNFDRLLKDTLEKLGIKQGASDSLIPPVVEGQGGKGVLGTEQAASVIQSVFTELGTEGVEVANEGGGVMVRVPGNVFFEPGSAELKEGGLPAVIMVSKLMQKYSFDLHILGHTDSVPLASDKYPSNWELSGARAASALRFLAEKGVDPKRLIAVGFADSRPVADNATFEGRQKNRRIEFLFKSPTDYGQNGKAKPALP